MIEEYQEKIYHTQDEVVQLPRGLERSLALLGYDKKTIQELLNTDLPYSIIYQAAKTFMPYKTLEELTKIAGGGRALNSKKELR